MQEQQPNLIGSSQNQYIREIESMSDRITHTDYSRLVDTNENMKNIPRNLIQSIKNDAIMRFAEKDKHPSDILINDLCNSFLNSVYGEILLTHLKPMTQDNRAKTLQECIQIPDLDISQFQNISNKQDLVRIYKKISSSKYFLNEMNPKLKKYVKKWNLYERMIKNQNLIEQLKYLLQSIFSKQKGIGNSKLLALMSYYRLTQNIPNLDLHDLWKLVFQEEFPKRQKIHNIIRKSRQRKIENMPLQNSYKIHQNNAIINDYNNCITTKMEHPVYLDIPQQNTTIMTNYMQNIKIKIEEDERSPQDNYPIKPLPLYSTDNLQKFAFNPLFMQRSPTKEFNQQTEQQKNFMLNQYQYWLYQQQMVQQIYGMQYLCTMQNAMNQNIQSQSQSFEKKDKSELN